MYIINILNNYTFSTLNCYGKCILDKKKLKCK